MRSLRRRFSGAVVFLLLLPLLLPAVSAEAPSVSLTVLFTHDTHDHFYPDSNDAGGYVRLATLLRQQRQTGSVAADGASYQYPTITVDAGDFSMGTLFQSIYPTDAPELRALGAMGYDVVTAGNHEFDYRGEGFAKMLRAAKASGDPLPGIVMSNYSPDYEADPGIARSIDEAMDAYPVSRSYILIEKEDGVGLDGESPLRVAVFGINGQESHEYAPMSGMVLADPVKTAQKVVDQIEADGGADFVICLSHSGTEDGKGEDYELAKQVKGIDLIVSGHSHTLLEEPIKVKDTYIVSCGEYALRLGRITLSKKVSSDHTLTAWDYQLLPVDAAVAADPGMAAMAEEMECKLDEEYLSDYGLSYDQVLATAPRDFTIEETGNLIGDAYIATVKEAEGEDYIPVDFAVAPNGVIRDYLRAGKVTTSQAFDILSLGSGADGSPGYPLISVYLTGLDLADAFEVDASVSAFMNPAILYGSGMYWTRNPNRMLFDKINGGHQLLPDGTTAELELTRLYRVVADLYTGQMLGAVEDKSFGILAVTPRDENGEPIEDLESRILRDKEGNEIKSWYALANYLEQEGHVEPPAPRKEDQPSWNPIKVLGNPGVTTIAAQVLGIVIIGIIVLTVRRKRRRGSHRDGYRPYRGR